MVLIKSRLWAHQTKQWGKGAALLSKEHKRAFQRKGDCPETTNLLLGMENDIKNNLWYQENLGFYLCVSCPHPPSPLFWITPCIYVTLNIYLFFFKHSFRLALFPFCLQLCLSNCLFHFNCIREECSSSLSICIFLMWKHWDERCPSASTWKCGKGSLEKVFSSSPRAGEQRHQLQHLCSDKRHSGSGSSARGTGRRKGEEERQKRFGKTQMFQPCCIF